MKISDKDLDLLLSIAADAEAEKEAGTLEALDVSDVVLSDDADRRIRRLLWKEEAKRLWTRHPLLYRGLAAVLCLTIAVTIGVKVGLKNADTSGWDRVYIMDGTSIRVAYAEDKNTSKEIGTLREPTYMEAGFEKEAEWLAGPFYQQLFSQNGVITLDYTQKKFTGDSTLEFVNENCTVKQTKVGKHYALLIVYDNGSQIVTWYDEEYVYYLMFVPNEAIPSLDSELLIRLAESVR